MKKSERDRKSPFSVVKRMAKQEHLLSTAAVYESMRTHSDAQHEEAAINEQMQAHFRAISKAWQSREASALETTLSGLAYRQWLWAQSDEARARVVSAEQVLDGCREKEMALRIEHKLLEGCEEKYLEKQTQEALKKSYKLMDELVLLGKRYRNAD